MDMNLKMAGKRSAAFFCGCRFKAVPAMGLAEWGFCSEHRNLEPVAHETFSEQYGSCSTMPEAHRAA